MAHKGSKNLNNVDKLIKKDETNQKVFENITANASAYKLKTFLFKPSTERYKSP